MSATAAISSVSVLTGIHLDLPVFIYVQSVNSAQNGWLCFVWMLA